MGRGGVGTHEEHIVYMIRRWWKGGGKTRHAKNVRAIIVVDKGGGVEVTPTGAWL